MKAKSLVAIGTAGLFLAACAPEGGKLANDPPGHGRAVCIRTIDIDHTETPDDNTILFYMRGHKLFKNTLDGPCVGLKNNSRGFTYTPDPVSYELCSNLDVIHLNDTHQVCLLGQFTQVEPPTR